MDERVRKADKAAASFKVPGKMIEQRPRSIGFKSFLNWFKKVENLQRQEEAEEKEDVDTASESSEEDSSSSSTATVASFAFLPANMYKPYGDAAQPEKFFSPGPYTDSYLKLIVERNRRRSMDKNITLRKKYSLYTSGTTLHSQRDEINEADEPAANSLYDTFSLPTLNKIKAAEHEDDRRTASLSTKTGTHVKGKRRAPQPPISSDFIRSYRKKRKAPPPPLDLTKCNENPIPSPSKLEVQAPASAPVEISPKPWYKRDSKLKTKAAPVVEKKKNKHEFPDVGFFRCSQLFENIRNLNSDKVEQNEKRMSRFLPNISELDREAAEIIKQHKANMNNDETNESYWLTPGNRPSSTKELISKFNALSTSGDQKNINNNEIKLTSELIIRSNSKEFKPNLPSSPIMKKSNFTASPLFNKTPSSPKVPREGEISQSFKAEIFSAIPSLESADKARVQSSCNRPTQQDLEKLSYMEEKQKLKEQLKEMRNSLPKRPKPKKVEKDESLEESQKNDSKDAKKMMDEKASSFQPIDKVSANEHKTESVQAVDADKLAESIKVNEAAKMPENKPNGVQVRKISSEEPLKILNFLENLNKTQNNQPIYSNKVSSASQTSCLPKKPDPKTETPIEKSPKNTVYSNLEEIKAEDPKVITTVNLQSENLKNVQLPKLNVDAAASTSASVKEIKAVNSTSVLLKRLEQAISEGDDTAAAKLAKDLAMLKVNCLVTCSPTEEVAYKRVKIYIEDQFSHQGPIPMQVLENSTMGNLKARVEKELNIPIVTQRWIIGKQLAANDDELLSQYNRGDFETPLFLYVIAKKGKLAMPESTTIGIAVVIKKKDPPDVHPENPTEKLDVKINQPSQTTDVIAVQKEVAKLPIMYNPTASPALKNITKKTWACTDCTLINSLLSPICSACGKKYEASEQETKPQDAVNHYKQLLTLDDQDLVTNVEAFECPICFQQCEPTEGVTLRECIHSFCRECLENTVRYSDEAEVKCPYRDAEYSCDSAIQEREIRALVNKTMYETHLAKSVKLAENKMQNAFHCKTPDCTGWCVFDDNVNEFHCPACRKINCLTCQVIHEGKNCKQYQEQINTANLSSSSEGQQTKNMLDEMVKKGEALACPSCQVIMMKKWGCDWVRCSMCKTEICWVTRGPRWGPSGKGDITAGCQCGVNGVKCHPKCNYCH